MFVLENPVAAFILAAWIYSVVIHPAVTDALAGHRRIQTYKTEVRKLELLLLDADNTMSTLRRLLIRTQDLGGHLKLYVDAKKDAGVAAIDARDIVPDCTSEQVYILSVAERAKSLSEKIEPYVHDLRYEIGRY